MPTDRPIRIDGLARAEAFIRARIEELAHVPLLIAIGGRVGSGKSTLAARIAAPGGVIVSTDDYLPDYAKIPDLERDEPRHADIDGLVRALRDLLAGRATTTPVWSFQEHRRTGERRIEPADLVLVEGIHALHARVRELAHLRVIVEADAETRWARWARIEDAGERGWDIEHARWHFEHVAERIFGRYEDEYVASADVLVVNRGAIE